MDLFKVNRIALLLLVGCSACSTSGRTGNEDPDATQTEYSKFYGRAAIPFPVGGATVELLVVAQKDTPPDSVPIATGITESDGLFVLDVPTDLPPGTVMKVVVSGLAAKVHLPSGPVALGADATLEAAFLWEESQSKNLVVDLFSSLASARLDGLHRAKPASRTDLPTWQGWVTESNELMAEHLARPNGVGIPWQEPADMTREELAWPSPASALALGNLAFWRLVPGAGMSDLLGTLDALKVDLSDSILDGKGYLAETDTLPGTVGLITDQTTRYDLAKAIHQALTEPGFPLSEPPTLDVTLLGVKGSLYEMISMDQGQLYVAGQAVTLFDPFLPEIWFTVAPSGDGPEVCKGFTVEVQAKDNNQVSEIVLESPTWDGLVADVTLDAEAGTGKATVQVDPTLALESQETTLTLRFRAKDPSGNEFFIERTLSLHKSVPTLLQSSPTDQDCLGVWPDTFTVRATDDKGIAKVDVVTDGALYPCTPKDDDLWECQRVGESPVVRATDECGLTAEITSAFCVDGEAPTIHYEIGSELCGPAYRTATVSVTDNMGVKRVEVKIGADVTEIEDVNAEFEVFFPLDQGDPAVVTITAWDIWDRTATVDLTCPLDIVPPVLWPDEGAVVLRGETEAVVFDVQALDALSDVVDVEVTCDQGQWQVVQEDGLWVVSGTKEGGFKNGDLLVLNLVAADQYGNETLPYTVWVVVDGVAPSVALFPSTVIDEAGVIPTVDSQTLEVTYDVTAAPVVQLGPTQCQPSCPPFTKLPSRLSEEAVATLEEGNLPHFKFQTDEPCVQQVPGGGEATATAYYYKDSTLLATSDVGPVPCGPYVVDVPVTLERFSALPQDSFVFTSDKIPNRVVLKLVDEVGNTQESEVAFTMNIATLAPEISLDVPAELDNHWVGGCLDGEAPLLHEVVNQGRNLTRFRLVNPYPVPLGIRVTQSPEERVTISKLTIYSNPKETAFFQCMLNTLCKYWTPEFPEGECLNIIDYSTSDLFKRMNLATDAVWETQDGPEVDATNLVMLPPFSEGWIAVRNDYASQGFTLEPPTDLAIEPGVEKPIYVVEPAGSSAVCRAVELGSSFQYDLPTVLSWYASLQAVGAKLKWESSLLGEEFVVAKTTGVTWSYPYLPPIAMHEIPWK